MPAVQREVRDEIDAAEGRKLPFSTLGRPDFYARAKQAYCVIATGEARGYGCFIFKKGVLLAPDLPARA